MKKKNMKDVSKNREIYMDLIQCQNKKRKESMRYNAENLRIRAGGGWRGFETFDRNIGVF